MSNFTYSDELYHHGILGQKWGVRRYQNEDGTLTAAGKKRRNGDLVIKPEKSAFRYGRRLNKLDKKAGKAAAETMQSISDYDRYQIGRDRASAKGKDKKAAKYQAKMDKAQQKMQSSMDEMERYVAESAAVLAFAKAEGYTVNSTAFNRTVQTGRDKAMTVISQLGAMSAASLTGFGMGSVYTHTVPGNHYKVKKPKQSDGNAKTNKKSSGAVVMLTAEQAKKAGLDDSTKLSDEEASKYWKAMVEDYKKKKG